MACYTVSCWKKCTYVNTSHCHLKKKNHEKKLLHNQNGYQSNRWLSSDHGVQGNCWCMAFSWCGGTTEYNVEKSLCCLNDGYALAAKLPWTLKQKVSLILKCSPGSYYFFVFKHNV